MPSLEELDIGGAATTTFKWTHASGKGPVEWEVIMQLMTPDVIDKCRLAAARFVAERERDHVMTPELKAAFFDDAQTFEKLACALRNPSKPLADGTFEAWCSPSALRQRLPPEEVALLWSAYRNWELTLSPVKADMPPEAFATVLGALAEEGEQNPLDFIGPRMQRTFLRIMARLLIDSQMDKSSPTGQDESPEGALQ